MSRKPTPPHTLSREQAACLARLEAYASSLDDAEIDRLAAQALESLSRRQGEDVTAWAFSLAADVIHAND